VGVLGADAYSALSAKVKLPTAGKSLRMSPIVTCKRHATALAKGKYVYSPAGLLGASFGRYF